MSDVIEGAAKPKKPDILTAIVTEVLSTGATKFEVEYKDGEEHICVMHGAVGFGIASLQSSSDEAQELRAQLSRLEKKPRTVGIDGIDYLGAFSDWNCVALIANR